MRTFQIRSRGQIAVFAGGWLFAFVPFFEIGALQTTGYASATAASAGANPPTYAPLLAWASGHLGLVIAFPLIQIIPLILVLRLPELLQSVIDGEKGRIGRWCGVAGLALVAVVSLVNLIQIVVAAQQYAHATVSMQSTMGANYRVTAITASLIADLLGGVLLTIWLVSVNAPLVRLGGYERVIGLFGILVAALFAATAGLVAFNPQQPQGTLAGSAMAAFGLWLALTGQLLIRRAPALGQPLDVAPLSATPSAASSVPPASVPE